MKKELSVIVCFIILALGGITQNMYSSHQSKIIEDLILATNTQAVITTLSTARLTHDEKTHLIALAEKIISKRRKKLHKWEANPKEPTGDENKILYGTITKKSGMALGPIAFLGSMVLPNCTFDERISWAGSTTMLTSSIFLIGYMIEKNGTENKNKIIHKRHKSLKKAVIDAEKIKLLISSHNEDK